MDDEYIVICCHPLEWTVWGYCMTLEEAQQTLLQFQEKCPELKFRIYRRAE